MPVEDFPPAINIARYFADRDEWRVSLCTNRKHHGRWEFAHDAVKLVLGRFPKGEKGVRRILAYGSFHLKAFIHLLREKPDVVLYVEPHSAFPVFLSRLVYRRSKIFIHYHEYHTPADFHKPGMRMARLFHRLEQRWLYPVAEWISQTNESRLGLFLADIPGIHPSQANILPNYPPRSWWAGGNRAWSAVDELKGVVRFVYVGALSRADTFIEEAVRWVKTQKPGEVTLDIFSYNLHEETRSYLHGVMDQQIRFHEEGVLYDDLPHFLRDYHVGLILYKGNTLNYVHNASNKLFEYLACGLDVIFPSQMSGVKPYAAWNFRPRVIECDFENLDKYSFEFESRNELPQQNAVFSCESELERLESVMLT